MSLSVTVNVDAAPATVWSRWTDIPGWPNWNPACAAARLDGDLVPGTRAHLELVHPRGRRFLTAPVLTAVEPERLLVWETRALGVRAPTMTELTAAGTGTDIRLTSESRGALAFAYRLMFPEKTQGLLWSGALTALAQSFRAE